MSSARAYWADIAVKLAQPVLTNLVARRLKSVMPVETAAEPYLDRRQHAHLEAIGRLLAGLGPWFELAEPETQPYAQLAREALDAATDPASPDRLNFDHGRQPLVDAAFLAQGLLRAPNQLWEPLPSRVKANLLEALRATRTIEPYPNNWLLFAAMIEAFLHRVGEPIVASRVSVALQKHEEWYLGDGHYGDGPEFHWDYYNSFVIQPMLLEILETLGRDSQLAVQRARRYAAIQERLVSPEGTLPVIGRSITYRFGALQLLGQMAWRHQLPDDLSPAQVRCAMTAVLHRLMDAPGTFDADGWLRIGLCGHQPSLADRYISTGSLYLCAAGLLPLGLPPLDPFWAAPDRAWTSQRAWAGHDLEADHAL